MIALLRIANRNGAASSQKLAAAILFAITLLFMMAPGGLYLLPPPWKEIYVNLQAIIWIGDSIFLLVLARKNEKAAVSWVLKKPAFRKESTQRFLAPSLPRQTSRN